MDLGARAMVVAVPPERDAEPGRVFETVTPDLHALVDWLVACHMDTLAMASTGIDWVPIVARLEPHGSTPSLVHARHVKTVPGRQTDGNDAQWLQTLHTLGLWHASVRPEAEMCLWRTRLRHRAAVIEPRAPPLLHRHKALTRMNSQLSEGLTELTGVTGQAMLRAMVQGERDPLTLAQRRHPACTSSTDDLAQALTGSWRTEPRCILQQALELFDVSTHPRAACEAPLERQLAVMQPRFESDEPRGPAPRVTPGSQSTHQPRDEARADLARITGVDLVAVTGLSASMAQTIISEIGPDRPQFPPVKPFCSWLGWAPHHDISGGRVLRARTLNVVSRATPAFRQAAQSGARSGSACGASLRPMRARLGPPQATVATAHKIARVVYQLRKYHQPFTEESAIEYLPQRRDRDLHHRRRRAQTLGDTFTPVA